MERTYKTIALLAALVMSAYGVVLIGKCWGRDGFGVMFAYALFAASGLVYGLLFGEWLGLKMGGSLFYPRDNVKAAPPEFPLVRAKIAKGEAQEAAADLENILKNEPANMTAMSLLLDVYMDHLKESNAAAKLLTAFLSGGMRKFDEDEAVFVMRLVDIYLDAGRKDYAIELISRELRLNYPKREHASLSKRLDGIRSESL